LITNPLFEAQFETAIEKIFATTLPVDYGFQREYSIWPAYFHSVPFDSLHYPSLFGNSQVVFLKEAMSIPRRLVLPPDFFWPWLFISSAMGPRLVRERLGGPLPSSVGEFASIVWGKQYAALPFLKIAPPTRIVFAPFPLANFPLSPSRRATDQVPLSLILVRFCPSFIRFLFTSALHSGIWPYFLFSLYFRFRTSSLVSLAWYNKSSRFDNAASFPSNFSPFGSISVSLAQHQMIFAQPCTTNLVDIALCWANYTCLQFPSQTNVCCFFCSLWYLHKNFFLFAAKSPPPPVSRLRLPKTLPPLFLHIPTGVRGAPSVPNPLTIHKAKNTAP